MMIRTYLDACVLIAAATGTNELALRALQLLDDPGRVFVSSEFVRLETLPKPRFHRRAFEVAFYEEFFARVSEWAPVDAELARDALEEATRLDASPMDALHVAAAARVQAAELVTAEKPSKPMLRSRLVAVRSIHPMKPGASGRLLT